MSLTVDLRNRFGDKSDGPVLKGCGYGPNCFSTTGDPEDPQITTLLQPWKIPDGASVADASAQLEATVRAYPPGQQKVDGGGFQVVKAGSDGYLYAQFESLKKGKIDDVEFAINKDGTVQVRASGRIGLKADYGSNAKRLNYISEQLRAKGWTAPVITKDTHAYYFAMNSGKTKVQCVGIDCPVNYELIEEEPGPGESE
ncbi:kif19 [Symbiodinium sp. CCMP2592]|nr:kif19 [Symbiodinium sp. CCMP2592]